MSANTLEGLLRLWAEEQAPMVQAIAEKYGPVLRELERQAPTVRAIAEKYGRVLVLGPGAVPPMVRAIAEMYGPVFREIEKY